MIIADIKDYLESIPVVTCDIYLARATQRATQSTAPYVVINKVSNTPAHAFGGDTGFQRDRIQFTVVGNSYMEVNDIVEDLRALFATYNESDSSKKMGTTWVQSTEIANEVSDWTLQSENFFTILDVFFNYID